MNEEEQEEEEQEQEECGGDNMVVLLTTTTAKYNCGVVLLWCFLFNNTVQYTYFVVIRLIMSIDYKQVVLM